MSTRRSSRSQTKAAAAAVAEASELTSTPPQQDSAIATPHDSAAGTPTASSSDATHIDQTSALHHEKKDQTLEASDPDVNAASTEDLVQDAVSTPINAEIESMPVENHHDGTAEHEEVDPVKDAEPVHEIHLVGHIKGVPHHHTEEHKKDGEREVKKTEAHFEHHHHATEGHHHATESHHPTEGHHHSLEGHHHSLGGHHHSSEGRHKAGEDETIKHVKRAVEADSNTEGLAVDAEAQDYLTGAYKSPFRHAHKGEQAGKEQR
ncbi:hypothetical protein CPB97_009742 [Podila verticillata]|nr:hypothetical protein CPB97_009742 [Podila verticillata]